MAALLFCLKKIISKLFLTMHFILIIMLIGIIFKRYAWISLIASFAFLVIGNILGQIFLTRLSGQYQKLDVNSLTKKEYLIAVAGSGFIYNDSNNPETYLIDDLMIKLYEAARVAQDLEARDISYNICVSIPEGKEHTTEKMLALTTFFSRFGISEDKISIVDEALDSEDEVKIFNSMSEDLIIVSYNWHLPRLMLWAKYLKSSAIAAPAGQNNNFDTIFPTARSLAKLECVLHEIGGIIQAKIKQL